MSIAQEYFTVYLQELEVLKSITNFYEYEKKFSEIHTKFGELMLEKSTAQQSVEQNDKEYKKNSNQIWSSYHSYHPFF